VKKLLISLTFGFAIPKSTEQIRRGWYNFNVPTPFYHLKITNQPRPGSKIPTVGVFASHEGILPVAYYDLLNSDLTLELEIFPFLPLHNPDSYRDNLMCENGIFPRIIAKIPKMLVF
jgi:hypothetical protein